MKGPVPSSSLVGSKVPAFNSSIGRIAVMLAASEASSGVNGSLSSIVTVLGSVALMLFTEPSWNAHHDPKLGSMTRLMLEPETLQSLEPDVHLAATLVALSSSIPARTRDTAREVVRRIVDAVMQRVANTTRQVVNGALARSMPSTSTLPSSSIPP